MFLYYLGIQLDGVRSTSHVANNFIGTGLMFAPMLDPPPPDITNKFDAPNTPLELVAGVPLAAGAMVPELIFILPMPPIRLLEAVVELAPEAMVDPAFILCPLLIGVLGVPTTLAIIQIV